MKIPTLSQIRLGLLTLPIALFFHAMMAGPVSVAASSASPTPTPAPAQALNLSTRMRVQTGDQVGIGGFIITGFAPKHLLLRAIGPSLAQFGVPNVLADPVMELHGPGAFVTITNDNWRDDPVQAALIIASGIPPTNDLESAIDVSLDPGAYTAILRGRNNTSGVALIEVYDLAQSVGKLVNISTRAFVGTNDNIVIVGFLLGGHGGNTRIVVRGIGPSLTALGVPNALADPTLYLRDGNGSIVLANNDWQDDPVQAAALIAAGLAPTSDLEAGLVTTLSPGLYTALLAGRNNGTGLGLVEVYDLGDGSGSPTPTPPAPSPTPTPSAPPNPTVTPVPSPFPTPSPTPNPSATAAGSPATSPTPALSPTPTPTPKPTPCSGTAFPENFDGVTPPALPQGWGTSGSGNFQWVTSTTTPDTPPNDAFLPDQDGVSDTVLSSPAFVITSPSAVLSFRNNFDMEFSDGTYWDGCVLEVSSPNINAGVFTDITDPAVGGSFVTGGYTGVIDKQAFNPLADRMAWAGNSGGYIDTVVNLGPNVDGQTIRLHFRMGTDQAVAAPGWRIDTITLVGGGACPSPTPTPTPTPPCGISDGGFENGGIPSTIWNNPQTSTNFGTPLCDFALCGNGGGASPPRTGLVWSWFGGIAAPETATLGQDVTIPSGGSAALHFWMRIGTVNTPFTDVLNVRVDGGIAQSYPEPAVAEADYTERVIDLSAFADGAAHNIEFEYIGPSSGVGSYVVDDVSLVSNNACPTPTPSPTATPGTPSPSPSCPPVITQSSTQTITPLNSVSCNNGTGHTDNSYWRAFNMVSFVGSNIYNVTSVSFGIEQATGAGGTQPVTVRLHTSNQPFPTGFPGSLTQIATATVNVPDSASNTIFTVPIAATVPAGAILVMEVFTPDGTVAGNLLFIGSNADPESGPSYLSAPACGITTPTTTAAIGFPNMHIVFNVNASCGNVTPTPTATVAPSPTPTATATVPPTPTPTPSPVCPWSFGPPLPAVGAVRAPGNYFAANGRFYFIGGRSADVAGTDFTHPFEYNPATNAWTTKPSTLPDNKVNNMACGVLTVSGTPQIFCVGGNASQVVGNASRVFSYNPATDTFTTLAAGDDWPGSQAGAFLPGGFAVLGNKLYTIGSFNANSVPPVVSNQVWRFDPTAAVGSKWLALANYPVARAYIPAASIGSFIYTGGGSNVDAGGALIDSADSFRYDPASNTWSVIANIPRATGETRAVVMGNQMWVLGGGRTAPNPSNEVDSYDPVTNTWSIVPHFVTPRRNFAADSDGSSRLWVVGGYDSSGTMLLNTMEIYGPPNCP